MSKAVNIVTKQTPVILASVFLLFFQVLSSKLMPTSDDEMAKTSVKSFCENFLKAGGLR